MAKDLKAMLSKTANHPVNKDNNLVEQISQFEKADNIMSSIAAEKPKQTKKDKSEYVTYTLPSSYLEKMDRIHKLCMRNEVEINKSEIIRIGINFVANLTVDEVIELLANVKSERGRPKE